MKSLSLIFLLVSISIQVSGQHSDYYKDNKTVRSGIKLIQGSKSENFIFCQVKVGDQIFRRYPNEIIEYGFKDGRVFVAKDISIEKNTKRVYLQRLIDGKSKLYYYSSEGIDMYFVEENNGILVPLPLKTNKDSLQNVLAELTDDCPEISSKSEYVTFNKRILSNFIMEYNACKSLHLQRRRFGVFAGMVHTKAITIHMPPEIKGSFTYNPSNNLYFGLFMSLPIYSSDFSLYSSIGFFKSSYSSSISNNYNDAGILIKNYSLLVPVLLKYAPLKGRITPYLNLGVNYLYNLKNENILYRTLESGNAVQFEYFDEQVFADHEIGCTVGAGFQYEIDLRRVIFIEVNFNREFSTNQRQSLCNRNLIQLTSGINL